MRISDWSSDVCSSDLIVRIAKANGWTSIRINGGDTFKKAAFLAAAAQGLTVENYTPSKVVQAEADRLQARLAERDKRRSEEHTSELQSLMRNSYAVYCLKKKKLLHKLTK